MKVYRMVLCFVDTDEVGMTEAINHASPGTVMTIEARDIGEWNDDHPLNKYATREAAFNKLFIQTHWRAPLMSDLNDMTKDRDDWRGRYNKLRADLLCVVDAALGDAMQALVDNLAVVGSTAAAEVAEEDDGNRPLVLKSELDEMTVERDLARNRSDALEALYIKVEGERDELRRRIDVATTALESLLES